MPQLNYRQAVTTLATENKTIRSPVTGTIENAQIHFPLGCNALVGIQLIKGKKQLLPTNEGEIALDDTTQNYYVGEPVVENEEVTCRFLSHDDTHSHTITVVLWISEGIKQPENVQPIRGA